MDEKVLISRYLYIEYKNPNMTYKNYIDLVCIIKEKDIDRFSNAFENAIKLFNFDCINDIEISRMNNNEYYDKIVMNIYSLFNEMLIYSSLNKLTIIKNLNAWSSLLNYICLLLYITRDDNSLKYLFILIEYSSIFNTISKYLSKKDDTFVFNLKLKNSIYNKKIKEFTREDNSKQIPLNDSMMELINTVVKYINNDKINYLFNLYGNIDDNEKKRVMTKFTKKICDILIFNLDEEDIFREFTIDKDNILSFKFMINYINTFYIPELGKAIEYIKTKSHDNYTEYLIRYEKNILNVLNVLIKILDEKKYSKTMIFKNLDEYIDIIIYIYNFLLDKNEYSFLIAIIELYRLLIFIKELHSKTGTIKKFTLIDINKISKICDTMDNKIDEYTYKKLTKTYNELILPTTKELPNMPKNPEMQPVNETKPEPKQEPKPKAPSTEEIEKLTHILGSTEQVVELKELEKVPNVEEEAENINYNIITKAKADSYNEIIIKEIIKLNSNFKNCVNNIFDYLRLDVNQIEENKNYLLIVLDSIYSHYNNKNMLGSVDKKFNILEKYAEFAQLINALYYSSYINKNDKKFIINLEILYKFDRLLKNIIYAIKNQIKYIAIENFSDYLVRIAIFAENRTLLINKIYSFKLNYIHVKENAPKVSALNVSEDLNEFERKMDGQAPAKLEKDVKNNDILITKIKALEKEFKPYVDIIFKMNYGVYYHLDNNIKEKAILLENVLDNILSIFNKDEILSTSNITIEKLESYIELSRLSIKAYYFRYNSNRFRGDFDRMLNIFFEFIMLLSNIIDIIKINLIYYFDDIDYINAQYNVYIEDIKSDTANNALEHFLESIYYFKIQDIPSPGLAEQAAAEKPPSSAASGQAQAAVAASSPSPEPAAPAAPAPAPAQPALAAAAEKPAAAAPVAAAPAATNFDKVILINNMDEINKLVRDNAKLIIYLYNNNLSSEYQQLAERYSDIKFAAVNMQPTSDVLYERFKNYPLPTVIIINKYLTPIENVTPETYETVETYETAIDPIIYHDDAINNLIIYLNKSLALHYDTTKEYFIKTKEALDYFRKIFNTVIFKITALGEWCSGCNTLKRFYTDLLRTNNNNNTIYITTYHDELFEPPIIIDESLNDYFKNGVPTVHVFIKDKEQHILYDGFARMESRMNQHYQDEIDHLNSLGEAPAKGGGNNKYKKTDKQITVIYKKKEYTRVIYICERKKYVKINKTFMLLSKLKKV